MKKVCKNCEYWINSHRDGISIMGSCYNSAFIYTPVDNEKRSDGFYYWDEEGCHADFITGENFGCIHFKIRIITKG